MVADAWEKARLDAEEAKRNKFAAKRGGGGGGGGAPADVYVPESPPAAGAAFHPPPYSPPPLSARIEAAQHRPAPPAQPAPNTPMVGGGRHRTVDGQGQGLPYEARQGRVHHSF